MEAFRKGILEKPNIPESECFEDIASLYEIENVGLAEVVTKRVECYLHRVIMYHIEIKTVCCHTHFGQFLGSHQTLGGGVGRYFCRFYLAVYNAVLITKTTINKYIIIHNLHFRLETNLQN